MQQRRRIGPGVISLVVALTASGCAWIQAYDTHPGGPGDPVVIVAPADHSQAPHGGAVDVEVDFAAGVVAATFRATVQTGLPSEAFDVTDRFTVSADGSVGGVLGRRPGRGGDPTRGERPDGEGRPARPGVGLLVVGAEHQGRRGERVRLPLPDEVPPALPERLLHGRRPLLRHGPARLRGGGRDPGQRVRCARRSHGVEPQRRLQPRLGRRRVRFRASTSPRRVPLR